MGRPALSPAQARSFDYIKQYMLEHGRSPTYQQIADALGVSKVTVFERVGAIVKKGWLKRRAHKAYGIELADDPIETRLLALMRAGRDLVEAFEANPVAENRFSQMAEFRGVLDEVSLPIDGPIGVDTKSVGAGDEPGPSQNE